MMGFDLKKRMMERRQDIVAGSTTFVAMSYIIFTNPAVLQPIGMAAGPVLLWTCVIACVASAYAGWRLGTPTALACGMGLNVFIADYSIRTGIPWPHLLVTCGVVSLIVLVLSLAQARKTLLAAVPPQIFSAIKAGVGGLLVKVAITEVAQVGSVASIGYTSAILVFVIGLAVIVTIKWFCAFTIDAHPADAKLQTRTTLLDSSAFFISVIIMIPVAMLLSIPTASVVPDQHVYWPWAAPDQPLQRLLDDQFWRYCITFGIAVFFVLMMDIAGSPVEYFRPGNPGENEKDDDKNRIITRSLQLDSAINIVAPIAGVTPVVYYAENHVGWKAGGRSGWTAGTVALGFFLFAVLALSSIWGGWPISQWIPKFAVMPALFFVGLMIMAESFAQRFTPTVPTPTTTAPPSAAVPTGRVYYFIPAAVTVVMVTNVSFDTAIAAGILSYALISAWPRSYVGDPESYIGKSDGDDLSRNRRAFDLGPVYVGASVVLLLSLFR